MKLYVLSDLHNEFRPFPACSHEHMSAWVQADVIVLAGDIDQGAAGIKWARESFGTRPIVYVAGNHEFYGGDWERTLDDMRQAAREQQVFFLENDAVDISGVRFLGCTLWTDFDLFGEKSRDLAMQRTGKALADYVRIKNDSPQSMLAPQDTRVRHLTSRAWLERELAAGEPENTVVVTHHYPALQSCPPRYRENPVSAGFGSQLPAQLLARAGLWIHGHTHDSCDYELWHQGDDAFRQTRVVCNPRGYPLSRSSNRFENPDFDGQLLIEVEI